MDYAAQYILFLELNGVLMLLFSGKGGALFSDGDHIGHVTPASDNAVKYFQ